MLKRIFPYIVLSFFFVLLVFSHTSLAQMKTLTYATLEGMISHKLDGRPISGLLVYISGLDLVGRTDEDGRYIIRNIPIYEDQEKITMIVKDPNINVILGQTTVSLKSGRNFYDFSVSLTQSFKKIFGGERYDSVFSLVETSDGGYLISCVSNSFNYSPSEIANKSIYLIKIDKYGQKIWGRIYKTDKSFSNAYVESADNGYIVFGTSGVEDRGMEVIILRVDLEGRVLWEKSYGAEKRNDYIYNLLKTKDGEYVIVGMVNDPRVNKSDMLLAKFNKNGDKLWERIYGGKENDLLKDVIEADNGDYLVIGSENYSGMSKAVIYRVDRNGNLIWEKKLSGEGPVRGKTLTKGIQGYVIAGNEYKDRKDTIFVANINDKGDILWKKNFNKKDASLFVESIARDDQFYILCGYMNDGKISNSYSMKIDAKGELKGEIIDKDERRNYFRKTITGRDLFNIFLGEIYTTPENVDILLYKINW